MSFLPNKFFLYQHWYCFMIKYLIFFRLSPFVFFYGTVFDLDLVIDASDYGNDARFIRRSCQPNAAVSIIEI